MTPIESGLMAYRKKGVRGLVHKNRGRVPPNATPESIQQRVMALTQERYEGTRLAN